MIDEIGDLVRDLILDEVQVDRADEVGVEVDEVVGNIFYLDYARPKKMKKFCLFILSLFAVFLV